MLSTPNPTTAQEAAPGSGMGRKICVADDDPTSRTLLRLILAKWKYEVVTCENGEQAFRAMGEPEGPRLGLLDWMMPEMDGIQTCQRLRSEFPHRNLYLVLVTARTEDTDVISALRSGADDFVSKPFSPHVLQARIEVGYRTLDLQNTLSTYAGQMQQLAESRAAQLVHADRMASLGLLSASVAHEINNPASFLSVNVQTIQEMWPAVSRTVGGTGTDQDRARAKALDGEMGQILSEMDEGLSRIRQITSELRSFSRSGQGESGPISLSESVRKALRMCSIRLKDRVEVQNDVPDDLPRVKADSTKIEQVFVNLVMNAADALEECPVRRIRIRGAVEGDRVSMTFSDTGPGVPEDKAEVLFQPFYTTKAVGKGTGLGLYISRGLVEEFGGTLFLAPPDSGGACFQISLPALPEAT